MITNINKLNDELLEFLNIEKNKIKTSVEEYILNDNHSGIAQMIGRRYGYIWEKVVSIILENTDTINLETKIFYQDFVKFWINSNKIFLQNDCCQENAEKMLLKFLDENTGTSTQDLCDFTFCNLDKNYAIDTKFKFNSNDSNTVREIANSAIHLKEMGYIPILLMRRNSIESQQSPIKRFKKSGWNVISGKEASEFIYNLTGFDIENWIKHNMNIWDYLAEFHESLNLLRYGESAWDF